MNLEKLAQRMVDEKLDFLSLEDSIVLSEVIDLKTTFYWVGMIEEVENYYELSNEELIKEIDDIYGTPHEMIRVGRTDEFSEFTHVFCPAPTYIDLIK
jgi:hypothetical protein